MPINDRDFSEYTRKYNWPPQNAYDKQHNSIPAAGPDMVIQEPLNLFDVHQSVHDDGDEDEGNLSGSGRRGRGRGRSHHHNQGQSDRSRSGSAELPAGMRTTRDVNIPTNYAWNDPAGN